MADPILDKTKQSLAAFIRAVMSRVDFMAMYPCQIVSQNADSTLELKPDDARLPSLSNVQLRLGLPGCTAKVASGSRVLLGWYGGDPSKPFAALFESSTVTQLNANATGIVLNNGTNGVGRVGDQVQVTFTAANFAAMTPTCAAAPGPVVAAGPVTITGTITAGSATVKAG